MNGTFLGLTGVAGLLSVILVTWLWDYHSSDAPGQGLTQGFSAILVCVIWLLLGVLLAICGTRGALPGRMKLYASLLMIVAFSAQLASLSMLRETSRGDLTFGTIRLVVLVSPWLVILYCLGTVYAGLRGLQPVVAGILALFSAMAWITWVPRQADAKQQQANVERAYAEDQAKLESIRNMPDNTPVIKLLAYTDVPGMFTTQMPEVARARIRRLPHKQEEIQALLEQGSDLAFIQLNCFDLEVTPAMCAAARKNMDRIAGQWRENASTLDPRVSNIAGPIRFLVHRGCACDPELDAIQEALQAVPNSFEKEHFLKQLATIRATGGAE